MKELVSMAREIKAFRKEHGLTQEALSRMVGCTSTSVCRWEKGQVPNHGARWCLERIGIVPIKEWLENGEGI